MSNACQYLYFCTSNASKVSTWGVGEAYVKRLLLDQLLLHLQQLLLLLLLPPLRQYLYFCTSKASKARTRGHSASAAAAAAARPPPPPLRQYLYFCIVLVKQEGSAGVIVCRGAASMDICMAI